MEDPGSRGDGGALMIIDPAQQQAEQPLQPGQGAFLHDRYETRPEPLWDEPVSPMKRMSTKFVVEEEEGSDGVRNHQFEAWLEEDRRHGLNCKTLPLTLLTWLAFLCVAYFHGNVDDTFRMRECLEGAIKEVKARHTVSGIGKDQIVHINLQGVTSVDEMWSWIEGGLVPAVAGPPAKPGFVRTFNKVVGSIQLRETRFQSGECQVGKDLEDYYRQGCHSADVVSSASYGPNVAGSSKMSMDPAFVAGYGISGLSAFNSQRFFSWLDVRNSTLGAERTNYLRKSSWVDSGTKSLEAIIVFFNSEIQTYGHVNVKLQLERGGLINTDLQVRSLWATLPSQWYSYCADILWGLCVLKLIANSAQKAVDNKTAKSCIARWCKLHKSAGGGFWLGLDWLGIIVAFAIGVFPLIFVLGFSKIAEDLGTLGDSPKPMLGNETYQMAENWDWEYGTYYSKNAGIIEDIEHLMYMKVIHRNLMYWYAMIFLARWFKGFRGQARMAQITSTLAEASADLLHFAMIFAVLFINFAIAGHALFGSEVSEWSTITKALQSALGMAWGRVDFGPLYEIAPISSMVWMFGYVLTMCMISMNMLLAIISDHYGDCFHANNGGQRGYDLLTQCRAMLYECWWNASYVGRYVYRIMYKSFPKRVKDFRFTPVVREEESREEIPYEGIYRECHKKPLGFTTERLLRRAGCDRATAKHLMKRCETEVLRHVDEHYPLELLFDEFDESMTQYYFAMDTFSNELRSWFAEKSIGAAKMIPRQTRLDGISTTIEVAQHIEHKHHHHHSAETLLGKGHHHHHHRSGHDREDGYDKSGSNSQAHSTVHSQSQSRAESRSPSKATTTTARQSRY